MVYIALRGYIFVFLDYSGRVYFLALFFGIIIKLLASKLSVTLYGTEPDVLLDAHVKD